MNYHLITQKLKHHVVWQNFAVKSSKLNLVVKVPAVTELAEQLVGVAQPKQWIKITTQNDVFFTQANHKGIWRLDNPIQQGGTASIIALGPLGIQSKAIEIAIALPTPVVLEAPTITQQDMWLKGTAEPLSTIVIQHNEQVYRVTADKEGHWQIENPIYFGGSITLYAENADGLKSDIVGLAALPVFAPTVPELMERGEYLMGTADPDSTVVINYGDIQQRVEVDASGLWRIENAAEKIGFMFIEVYAENKFGMQSDVISFPYFIAGTSVTEKAEFLAGTAKAGAIIFVRYDDVVERIVVDESGQWRIENPVFFTGGQVHIGSQNQYGIASSIQHTYDFNPPLPPSIPNTLQNGEYLIGTADSDSTVVIRHNGMETRVKVNADGQWSTLNPIYGVGGFLSMYAENQYGLKSLEIGLAAFKIIPTSPSVLENNEILAGSAEAHHKIIVSSQHVDYVTYADSHGYWQMENPIKNGGFASVVAENKYGIKSDPYAVIKLQVQTQENELIDLDALLVQVDEQQGQEAEDLMVGLNTGVVDLLEAETNFAYAVIQPAELNSVQPTAEISPQRYDSIYDPWLQTPWIA